ncbi:hypothetical protein BpHYR1_054203 [Brachionus plicatilis]|uniref:Uncharacterized protein n=1 Tax=Brachionus plicatilis TaxID=10195 RepID=A0A3M7RJI7_BRAPC|nr:hypothetical protein BpHYR1_054203 [Brachionus plicatilis]
MNRIILKQLLDKNKDQKERKRRRKKNYFSIEKVFWHCEISYKTSITKIINFVLFCKKLVLRMKQCEKVFVSPIAEVCKIARYLKNKFLAFRTKFIKSLKFHNTNKFIQLT